MRRIPAGIRSRRSARCRCRPACSNAPRGWRRRSMPAKTSALAPSRDPFMLLLPRLGRLTLLAFLAATPVAAQSAKQQPAAPPPPPPVAGEKPAPYDAQLTRLAEVLGSIQYLR